MALDKEHQIREDVFFDRFAAQDAFYKKLIERCPIIFRREPMIWNWSIDVSEGWYLIVYELAVKIETLVQKYKNEGKFIIPERYSKRLNKIIPEREELPLVTQVKQKFGRLCFYTMGTPAEVEDWIDEAEELASRTCEICGAEEDVTTESVCGWISTLCPKCMRNGSQRKREKFENFDEFMKDLFEQMKEIDEEIERRKAEEGL